MFSPFPTYPRSPTVFSIFPLALTLLLFRKQTGKQINKQKFPNKLQHKDKKENSGITHMYIYAHNQQKHKIRSVTIKLKV